MFLTKRKLLEAEARIAVLWQGHIDGRYDLREVNATAAKLAATVEAQNLVILQHGIVERELREKCKELAEHIKRMNEIPTQYASGPLWMSEEEEDAREAYRHGDINQEMLDSTLKELGLDPTITME